ncbi:MAG: flagellar hook-associated protein FlgL [Tepidisphaeraceae bacterium]|jgi:flagellar hook-associated protein 3 FlgL
MSITSINTARVSLGQQLALAQRQLSSNESSLLDVQTQLSTGKRINKLSDDPAAGAAVLQLRKTLADRQAYAASLTSVSSNLGQVDSTLGNLTDMLRQAQQTASANVGSTVSADDRTAAASVISSLYSQVLSLANQQNQGVYLFGGDQAATAPYVSDLGGVRFAGSQNVLSNEIDAGASLALNVPAGSIFGDMSSVKGSVDLTGPNATAPLTPLTNLADLKGGMGLDLASGFVITNGTKSATIDLSGAKTLEDVFNRVKAANVGAVARINSDGTGIDICNTVQGTAMSVTENGGTTATDLGIRTFSPTTRLADLNDGGGIGAVVGNDLEITRSDGTKFQVDLGSAQTVQDAIDAINAASGGTVAATFSSTGANGIILTDNAGGSGSISVASINGSNAAAGLGLDGTATGNTVLTGRDVGAVHTSGIFTSLANLQNALIHNDQNGITTAAEALQNNLNQVVLVRGQVGAMEQEANNRQTQIQDQNTTTQTLLSNLEDVDYNQAVTQFQTLQTALQAQLETTGKILNQSLMDYLQ